MGLTMNSIFLNRSLTVLLGLLIITTDLSAQDGASNMQDAYPPLYLERDGIALSHFPSFKRLKVSTRLVPTKPGASATWTARTDAAWLKVTPSGDAFSNLVIAALPDQAPVDQSLLSDVVVTLTDALGRQSQTHLSISFWKGSSDPIDITMSESMAASVAANSVRPEAYVAIDSDIKAYSIYTGALLWSMNRVAPALGRMQTSSDGKFLFISDTTNISILTIDLDSRSVVRRSRMTRLDRHYGLTYARPNGRGTLFVGQNRPLDAGTGKYIGEEMFMGSLVVAVNPTGTRAATVEASWPIRRKKNGQIMLGNPIYYKYYDSSCRDVAISNDARRIYPACGSHSQFNVYDAKTGMQIQALESLDHQVNAHIDADGNFVGGASTSFLDIRPNVLVYDKSGRNIRSGAQGIASQVANMLSTSGDTLRSATLHEYDTGVQRIHFQSLTSK